MENLSDVYLSEYIPTIYTTPCTLHYKQNGKDKKWEIFAERNGVVIIVYNKSKNTLVLVKQFRPSAFIQQICEQDRKISASIDTTKYPARLGVTLEFCAGLEDKNISMEEIAKEEILEECGYDVHIDQLEKIATIKNLSITTGARSTFYYCEVSEDMRVHAGGGVDGENIEVVEMPVDDVISYANNTEYVSSPVNFMYGLYWFLQNKYKKDTKL